MLTSYGDGDDASVIAAIERAMRATPDDIDIVVMAFGSYGTDDRPPPMAGAIRRLLRTAVVVASAGNDSTSRPYYPAALPGVIGVGAVDADGRAAFSNFGSWVDACTPGVDVVSTFFTTFDDRCHVRRRSSTSTAAGPRGAARASARPRSPGRSPSRCTCTTSAPRRRGATSQRPRVRHPDLGVLFNV